MTGLAKKRTIGWGVSAKVRSPTSADLDRTISTPKFPGPRSIFSILTKTRKACGSINMRAATRSAKVSSRLRRSSESSPSIASVTRS